MGESKPKFEEETQIQEVQERQSEKELKWQEAEQGLEKFGGIEQGIKDTVVALNVFGIETVNSCEGHNNHGRIAPWVSIEKWESKPREKYLGQKDFERVVYERLGITEDFLKRNSDYIREFDERRASLLPSGKVEPDETTDWEKHSKEIVGLDEELRKKYGIMHSDDRKWVEAVMRVEKEVEDAGKEGGLQETEEYKKWKEENDAMKDRAQQLLDEFYKDRKVDKNTRVIIDEDGMGSWCLHNGGKDYYDVTRKEDEIPDTDKKHYQKVLDGKNPKKEQGEIEERVRNYRAEFQEFAKFLKEKHFKEDLPHKNEYAEDEEEIEGGLGIFVKRKTLYHGSATAGIKRFTKAEEDTVGSGIYFTSKGKDAIGYARRRSRSRKGTSPIVYETSVENMKLLDLRNDDNVRKILDGFKQILNAKVKEPNLQWNVQEVFQNAVNSINQKMVSAGNLRKVTSGTGQMFSDYVRHLGYDGLIAIEGGEGEDVGLHDTYLIFDPEKVKIKEEHKVV